MSRGPVSVSFYSWAYLFACGTLVHAAPADLVTVLLDFDHPHSDLSVREMEREAGAVLGQAGYSLEWQLSGTPPPQAGFKEVLVIKMTGRCAADPIPMPLDERGPLGLTFVSDGKVLSFGEVHCDRIKQSLRRTPWRAAPGNEVVLGRALGRVAAHEMYHMLRHDTAHAKAGIGRASLTADELTANHLDLLFYDRANVRHNTDAR